MPGALRGELSRAASRPAASAQAVDVTTAAATAAVAAVTAAAVEPAEAEAARAIPAVAVPHPERRQRRMGVAVGLRLGPGLLRADLVAERDEERRHMLAVPVDLRERRARALAGEPGRGDLELHGIRLGVRAPDAAPRREVLHGHVGHRLATDVVVTPQERARAQEPPEGPIVELAQRFRERSRPRFARFARFQ
jgi:hypothetical protein